VVILCPGPIGLLSLQMGGLCGASLVVVVGLADDQPRLEFSRHLGADVAMNLAEGDPVTRVRALTGGEGADLIVDGAGDSLALRTAVECVRPTGQITKIGWRPAPVDVSLDPLIQEAATLRGSFSHTWPMWERCLRLMKHGQLQSQLLVKVLPLSAWLEGVSLVERREAVNVLLKIRHDADEAA
jgi:alcohol dehydrogenase/L-iditol 2-dehydrogenase